MLILSRQQGQSILIGDDIVITVTRIDARGTVQIGVSAPPQVPVDREEIRERKLADRFRIA